MRPIIEQIESRMLLAAHPLAIHAPSSTGITKAAGATKLQISKAKATSNKNLAKIKKDFARLKLTKSQAAIVSTVTADAAAGYKALTSKINVASLATGSNIRTLLADVRAFIHKPSDTSNFAKFESDVQAILSASGVSLSSLLSASAAFASQVSSDLAAIAATAPTDAELQADVQAAQASQTDIDTRLTAAAQVWLNTSIAAFSNGLAF